jgi:hypothetical protein
MLRWIEFRAVRGKVHQMNITWDLKIGGTAPTCSIGEHENEFIWVSLRDLFKKNGHGLVLITGRIKESSTPS